MLFDKGYISFDEEGKVMISDKLDEVDQLYMNIRKDTTIEIYEENKKYLKYHREKIFNKELCEEE